MKAPQSTILFICFGYSKLVIIGQELACFKPTIYFERTVIKLEISCTSISKIESKKKTEFFELSITKSAQ